jgi:hypothetical protein
MADITTVNPQILNTLDVLQQTSMLSSVIKHAGAGKAYQSVAQSAALAIQDAADNMRNMNTMSATAMGVALAQMLATKDLTFAQVITQAQNVATNGMQNFAQVGQDASALINSFPVGD